MSEHDWKPWLNSFGIVDISYKDCGARGECQFLSISEALSPLHNFSAEDLRTIAANEAIKMSKPEFENIIAAYREEVKKREFVGGWDPRTCTSPSHFAREIQKPITTGNGNYFQGDDVTRGLLIKALKVNMVVFDHNESSCVHWINEKFPHTIFLLFRSGCKHYQVLGLVDHSIPAVQTIFETKSLPKQFARYLKEKVDQSERKTSSSQPAPPHFRPHIRRR